MKNLRLKFQNRMICLRMAPGRLLLRQLSKVPAIIRLLSVRLNCILVKKIVLHLSTCSKSKRMMRPKGPLISRLWNVQDVRQGLRQTHISRYRVLSW